MSEESGKTMETILFYTIYSSEPFQTGMKDTEWYITPCWSYLVDRIS